MDDIRIAAGAVDITPLKPATLGGYRDRHAPFESIADGLEGNILILIGHRARLVFVTIDALYPGGMLRQQLLHDLSLEEHELFLAASHTHFAPMTCAGMPGIGVANNDYVAFVAERLVKLVRSLEGRAAPLQIFFSQGKAHHSINRRLARWRLTKSGISFSWGLAPNPQGPKDESISCVQFRSGGRTMAILWAYACHPTDFPFLLQISADFPGVVRSRLRETYGDIPVLFLQGFSGDTRPPFSGLRGAGGLLRRLLQGPQFRSPDIAEWRAWANDLASCVLAAISNDRQVDLGEPLSRRMCVAEEDLGFGGNGDKPLVWHLVDFGGFRVLGVNAEPVTAYRRLIEPLFQGKPLLTSGCIDQTHGYLPTDAMLPQGGYEVDGFRDLFDYRTKFHDGMQNAVLMPLRLANEAGRGAIPAGSKTKD